MPWDADIADDALLAEFAHEAEHRPVAAPRYWFSSPAFTHTRDESLAIIRFCQELSVPVDDVLSSTMFGTLVDRVVALETHVRRMDRPASG
jgi:hypothetical protein